MPSTMRMGGGSWGRGVPEPRETNRCVSVLIREGMDKRQALSQDNPAMKDRKSLLTLVVQ